MEKSITPDIYSFASNYLESFFNEMKLSNASCFFYEFSNKIYLVTNWHVVTGKDANTFKHLSKTAAEPNLLKVNIFKRYSNEAVLPGYILTVPLYDEYGRKKWIERKNEVDETMVDVAIIPVSIPDEATIFPINGVEEPFNEDTMFSIKDDVFVIGYPFGINCSCLPIWKRASIASEPSIDINNKPIIFIDTTTKPGMSGSPVIYKEKRGVAIMSSEENKLSRHYTKFVGVYSGRVYAENIYEAQLGIVWKTSVIEKMISSISSDNTENTSS